MFGCTAWAQRTEVADRHTVLSRSGAFYRGTVVDRVAESHLIILLNNGTRVRIELGDVLDETDEAEPPFQRSASVMGPDGVRRSGAVVQYKPGRQLILSAAPHEPIPLSADSGVCFVDTREKLVLLRSGIIYRGVIVARVAGSHLRLHAPDGGMRQVQLADIDRELAAPPGDPTGLATLTLSSGEELTEELSFYEPGKGLTLRSQSHGLRNFPLTASQQVLLPKQLSTMAATQKSVDEVERAPLRSAIAPQQQESPSADPAASASKVWAVTTTTGSTFFGRLVASADKGKDALTLTTRSGMPILLRGNQIVGRWLVEQLASVPVERIVIARCPWSRIAATPVRDFFISGEAPFRATINAIKPGRSITIHRLDATSEELRSVSFDELEQIRRPPEVNDICLPPPPPEGTIPVRILSDHTLDLHDKDKELIEVLHAEQTVNLLPNQRYQVSGPGIPKDGFQVPLASGVEVTIRAGSTHRQGAGVAMMVVGGVSVVAAIILGVGAAAAGSLSASPQNDYGNAKIGAGISGGVGLALLITGICLTATGGTDVQVESRVSTLSSRARIASSGPRLTARGLEF